MKMMKIQILLAVVLLGSAVAVQGSMSRASSYAARQSMRLGQMRFSSGVQGRESKPAKLNWVLSGKDKAAYLKFRGIEQTPEELEEEILVPSKEYGEYLASLPRVPRQKADEESYPFPEVKVIVNPNYKPRQQQQELQEQREQSGTDEEENYIKSLRREIEEEDNKAKQQGRWQKEHIFSGDGKMRVERTQVEYVKTPERNRKEELIKDFDRQKEIKEYKEYRDREYKKLERQTQEESQEDSWLRKLIRSIFGSGSSE